MLVIGLRLKNGSKKFKYTTFFRTTLYNVITLNGLFMCMGFDMILSLRFYL